MRPELTSAESIKELLDEKHISYNEWLRVDSFEKKEGEKRGRPRVKVTRLEEILGILETRALKRDGLLPVRKRILV